MAKIAIVHPLVILSITDHFERSGYSGKKRVIGSLLGKVENDEVTEITNSFAVPFGEDQKHNDVWFFDNEYHKKMKEMFLKVNAKEVVVGWYSTGPNLKPNDLKISALFNKLHCKNPILLVINTLKDEPTIKPKAYVFKRQNISYNLIPIKSIPKSSGPEEIGVEQLLRDVNEANNYTKKHKNVNIDSIKKLNENLKIINDYINDVEKGSLRKNEEIYKIIHEILNNLYYNKMIRDDVKNFNIKESTNDLSLILYISSLINEVLALSDLVENRIDSMEIGKKELKKLTEMKSIV